MSKLMLLFIFIVNVFFMQSTLCSSLKCDSDQNDETTTTHIQVNSSTTDHKNSSQKNETNPHCCVVCHVHMAMIFTNHASPLVESTYINDRSNFSYYNLHSANSLSSPFRPPIA